MSLKRRKSSKQQLCQETIVGFAAYELGVSVDMKTLSIEVQRIRNFWIKYNSMLTNMNLEIPILS